MGSEKKGTQSKCGPEKSEMGVAYNRGRSKHGVALRKCNAARTCRSRSGGIPSTFFSISLRNVGRNFAKLAVLSLLSACDQDCTLVLAKEWHEN